MQTRDPNRVLIFDTTLRDGEQSPGCSMTQPEKLRLARALADLGVDIIEAGFPVASRGDWESVQAIAREVEGPVIAGLARCNAEDIDRAWAAIRDARAAAPALFLATSAIHREHKLNMAREEIVHAAAEGVEFARTLCEDVEFSPEDASRTELEFLAEVVEAAVAAGATTINIPDTVGYTVPEEYYEIFQYLKTERAWHRQGGAERHIATTISAWPWRTAWRRYGQARARSSARSTASASARATARSRSWSWRSRPAPGSSALTTGIDTRRLYPVSRLLSSITGMPIPRNKAVVGENAFAHESGIHQHGMLKHHSTYEIMRPEDVGLSRTQPRARQAQRAPCVPRARARARASSSTIRSSTAVFEDFKALADKKKELFDGDIEALVLRVGTDAGDGPWQLGRLHVESDSAAAGSARVVLRHSDGRRDRGGRRR